MPAELWFFWLKLLGLAVFLGAAWGLAFYLIDRSIGRK